MKPLYVGDYYGDLAKELGMDVADVKYALRHDTTEDELRKLSRTDKLAKLPIKHGRRVWWHGSPSGDLSGGKHKLLHVGSFKSAMQALNFAIGTPVEGFWDGTREYGKVKLCGQKTMNRRRLPVEGYFHFAPDEDFYMCDQPLGKQPLYADNTKIPLTVKPSIYRLKIKGEMQNTQDRPMPDAAIQFEIEPRQSRLRKKQGYFYRNEFEDSGSISAMLPAKTHVARSESVQRILDFVLG
jgi:hypothetical protein